MLDRIRLLAAALVDVDDLAEAGDLVSAQLVAALDLAGAMATRLRADGRVELVGSVGAPEAMTEGYPRALIDDLPPTDVIRYGADIWVSSRVSWVERFPELATRTSQMAAGNVPIEVGGRVVGALSLIVDDDRIFAEEERRFVETMAVLLAGVVSRIVEAPDLSAARPVGPDELVADGEMAWAPVGLSRSRYRVPLLVQLLVGILLPVTVATVLAVTGDPNTFRPGSLFLACVVVAGALAGLRAGIAATAIGIAATLAFGSTPRYTFSWNAADRPGIILYVVAAGIVLTLVDRLERTRRTATIQRELVEAVVDNAPIGVALFDRKLRCVAVNERLTELDGIDAEDHVGRTPTGLWGDALADLEQTIGHVLETGAATLDTHVTLTGEQWPDLGTREYHCSSFPVLNRGEVVGVATLVNDVTVESRRRRDAAEILDWTQAMASPVTRTELQALIVMRLRDRLGARVGVVTRADTKLRLDAVEGYDPRLESEYVGRSAPETIESPFADALSLHDVVVVEDLEQQRARYPGLMDAWAEVGDVAIAVVPMYDYRKGNEPAGGLRLSWPTPRRLDRDERRQLRTLGTLASLAFGRVDAIEENQRNLFRGAVDALLDDVAIGTAIRDRAGRIVDFRIVHTNADARANADGGVRQTPLLRPMSGLRMTEAYANWQSSGMLDLVARVVETGEPLVLERFHYQDVVDGRPVDGYWNVQVVKLGDDGYLAASRDMTEVVAAEMALEESRRADAVERVAIDLLQQVALPERLPEVDQLRLGAVYLPSDRDSPVGGDWYDAFELPDGRIGLVLGDIAGHGRDSAVDMVRLRTLVAMQAADGSAPDLVLNRTNEALMKMGRPGGFATCVYMVIDPTSGEVTWTRAGHPPPLHLHAGGAVLLEELGGPPLGVLGGQRYEHSSLQCQSGDTLVVFTDGLIERRHRSIDDGIARLEVLATQLDASDPTLFSEAVAFAMFQGGERREDDLCVVTCHFV
jgi:PAS domain-containing protein